MLHRLNPYPLCALLALRPVLWIIVSLTSDNPRMIHILVHPTGEWAARLLIITLMMTPLAMLLKGRPIARWLRKSRRHFGVASFVYAAIHTAFYLIDTSSVATVIAALPRLYIWTGWIAFIIFIPLALTSTDAMVRRLGRRWKTLQRWVYPAAVLTLVHWASIHDWDSPGAAIVHFAPLAALELWRLWYWQRYPHRQATPA
ncbi:sulfoxide reductase heme-binding subunit YedZ [Loktanella sp. DSM 29012]|uniref:sulfite oxidase heme-binding subunit YedZ n=1 Tax=Loktanella sp. DSM 29012 TaxID=1881056 RepID=UPI0008B22C9C|nr:ferric reductase-like transmembrane domain-containing protein [Loktanella sp. DSM 29012]SEQ53009.1 sulfoxide reductase heme-binding subunit YedZ [Loktanella sp. DSM 29012]